MKPDEKYMPKASFRADEDINFEPFSNETILPSSFGDWLPVVSFDNLSVATMPNSIPNSSQINSQFALPDLGIQVASSPNMVNLPKLTTESNIGSITGANTGSMTGAMTGANVGSNTGANIFPDVTSTDILYSYNKDKHNTSQNINSGTNMNSNINNLTTNQSPINRDPVEYLREINLDLDEEIDLPRCSGNKDIGKIYKKIEDECPGTISLLQAYNIPVPIAKLIIRNVIKTSLNHCKE